MSDYNNNEEQEKPLSETHPHIHQYILDNLDKFISCVEGRVVFAKSGNMLQLLCDKFGDEGNNKIYKWLSNNYGDSEQQYVVVFPNGNIHRYKGSDLHSWDDQPAIVYNSGFKQWFRYNKLERRLDKNGKPQPITISSDGTKMYCSD